MMIQLKGINKTYFNGAPLHVLKGIDLDIEKGEMVSIMGASGSGKSTLLNILGILDTYDTGTYLLNGQLIQNLSESRAAELRNRMIGFIFQSFNLISFKNEEEKRHGTGISRHGGIEGLGGSYAERDVRRTEATCGHRTCLDRQAADYIGRRAYRGIG